ncbi:hypothetical protein AGMMS49579_13670 [Spirochaetia bacterium]|nr:hypothetical protein AGMMS49579_13670 [Spirochaetia bacterium]
MKKRVLFVGMLGMALTFGSVSGVFAAPGLFDLKSGPTEQKNAVFLDVGTLATYLMAGGFGGGVGYERAFGNSFSGLIHAGAGGFTYDILGSKNTAFAFEIDVHGRWYFFKTSLDKAFIDLGLGYEYYGYTYENASSWNWNQSSLTITPKAGWKFIFGKGFVLEPSIGYTIGIGLGTPEIRGDVSTHNASGLAIGVGLGWAF